MNNKQVFALMPYGSHMKADLAERGVKMDNGNSYYDSPQTEMFKVMGSNMSDSHKIRFYEDLLKRHLSAQNIQTNPSQTTQNVAPQTNEMATQTDPMRVPMSRTSFGTPLSQRLFGAGRQPELTLEDELNGVNFYSGPSTSGDTSYSTPQRDDSFSQLSAQKMKMSKEIADFDELFKRVENAIEITKEGIRPVYAQVKIQGSSKQSLINYLTTPNSRAANGYRQVFNALANHGITPSHVKEMITNPEAFARFSKEFKRVTGPKKIKGGLSGQSGSGLQNTWNGKWIPWATT